MRQTVGRAPQRTVSSRRKVGTVLAACGIGASLSFMWTAMEAAIISLWPPYVLLRIFTTLVVYAVLPMSAARRVKRLYPHGIGLRSVVTASIAILFAVIFGREAVFELLRRFAPNDPISILAPYSPFEPLLPLVVFYFTLRSFQEGAEFSARGDMFDRYGPLR